MLNLSYLNIWLLLAKIMKGNNDEPNTWIESLSALYAVDFLGHRGRKKFIISFFLKVPKHPPKPDHDP
jgi:hypothetical protein